MSEVITEEIITEDTPSGEAAAIEGPEEAPAANETASQEPAAGAEEAQTEESETKAEESETKTDEPETKAAAADAADDEDTMAAHDKEINESFINMDKGAIVQGTVLSVDEAGVTLDLRAYAEGFIPAAEYSRDSSFDITKEIHTGENISATVIGNDKEGRILLSRIQAVDTLGWDELNKLKEEKTNIEVTVRDAVKGGVVAFVSGVRGFIPASKLALGYVEDLSAYVGQKILVRVTEADKKRKRLILSAREILRDKEKAEKESAMSAISVGSVLTGTVDRIEAYGAFIKLDGGVSGLLHVSQISNKRVKHPADVLKLGQEVEVKVLDNSNGRLRLSMKALEEPEETYEEDEREERRPRAQGRRSSSRAPRERDGGYGYDDSKDEESISYKMPKAPEIGTNLGDLMAKLNIK